MARWFANNVSLMILALLLAVFVWMLASLQQDPILESTIAAPVVITSQPLQDQTLSASTLPPTITVRLRAPQSVFETMGNNGVQVPVDLSQLGAGEHIVSLAPVINGSPSQLISARPTTATVTIEQVVTQVFPIRISLVGTPAIGYEAQTPTATPQQATISGTQQVISQVASVDAIVTIDNVRASIEQAVRLVARNADGGIVGNVGIVPEAVAVKVPMEQLSNYRDLAVRAQLSGQPAEGYAITNIGANPQVVTVFGPKEAILQLPGFIETLEVTVQDAIGDIEQQVGLNVPPNVSLVSDNQSVLVRVRIEPQTGARTVSRTPTVIGITAPLTATLSPPSVDIVLSGPLPQLNALTENDVRVEVDASGLATGVQQLTPRVITPDGITVQSVLPATVQIEVRDESAPTPTSP
jgi:YbbR domain-containing protein